MYIYSILVKTLEWCCCWTSYATVISDCKRITRTIL